VLIYDLATANGGVVWSLLIRNIHMKVRIIAIGVWFFSVFLLPAQTFRVIYHFTGSSSAYVNGQLFLIGNTLYGTTGGGGTALEGTVFKVNTNGTGYKIIKNFSALDTITFTNADGAQPMAGLVLWSNQLYGTTYTGGSGKRGTIFGVDPEGTNFVVLNNFSGTNGKNPYVGLTLSDNTLFGATAAGGISNKGAIFRVDPDGGGYTVIKSFLAGEGVLLMSPVIVDRQTIYGTTMSGGISNRGTIFSVGTNGDGFTVLKTFAAGDGSQPRYGLILCGKTLYGVTDGNGVNSNSIVYRMNTDGSGYNVLKRFSEPDPVSGTNADGSYLQGGMVMWDGVLYGTAGWGGLYDNGVVFKINPDGTGFAILKQFPDYTGTSNGYGINSDGAYPRGDLMVANGVLYGVTLYGGNYGDGTLFSLTIPPPPPLQITNLADQALIFWNDDGLNRILRTTADLVAGNWTNVTTLTWTNAAANPKQIGFQITNCFNSPAAFFRLQ